MSCCAPPIFGLSPLDNFGVVAPEILIFYIDYLFTNFAERLTQHQDYLESSNFTGTLSSICCCATPIFGLSPLDNFVVIAPEIFNFT